MIINRALRQLRKRRSARRGPPPAPEEINAASAKPEDLPAPVMAAPGAQTRAPKQPIALPFEIRPADPVDLPELAPIFEAAILRQTGNDYTEAQLRGWASSARDVDGFARQLSDGVTILAVDHGQPVAFAQLAPADTLAMLYVHPEATSRGIATLLCQYLEDEARISGSDNLTTRASLGARRFFESLGFCEKDRETVERDGVAIERVVMVKKLK